MKLLITRWSQVKHINYYVTCLFFFFFFYCYLVDHLLDIPDTTTTVKLCYNKESLIINFCCQHPAGDDAFMESNNIKASHKATAPLNTRSPAWSRSVIVELLMLKVQGEHLRWYILSIHFICRFLERSLRVSILCFSLVVTEAIHWHLPTCLSMSVDGSFIFMCMYV